jgi:anti-sigma factor RsiW
MSCAESRLVLSACHDAELMPDELQRLRAYLGRCAECARLFDALTRTSLLVKESLVYYFAPDGLRGRIRETLALARMEESAQQAPSSISPLVS